jgi:hypothetical protein
VFDDSGAAIKHTIKNPVNLIDEETEDPLPEEYLLATFPEVSLISCYESCKVNQYSSFDRPAMTTACQYKTAVGHRP